MMSAPQPHKTITCQQVLKDGHCTHSGWLRKRTSMHQKVPAINKLIPWTNMYVVLSQGCVYLFSSDTSNKPVHPFSLHGYDKVLQAGEILQKDVPWPFKLVPVHLRGEQIKKKVRYFSAGSEREQKLWMTEFKKQMMFANGKGLKVSHSTSGDGDSVSLSVVQESVYTDAEEFQPDAVVHDDSDSEGESYNHIDDWQLENDSRRSGNRRPLPPPPSKQEEPTTVKGRKKLQSTESNRKADIDARPPVPIPGPQSQTSPVSPTSPTSRFGPRAPARQPPPPPDSPPEDSPPASPLRRNDSFPSQGNVSNMVSAFSAGDNKPKVAQKPKIPFGVKLLPTPADEIKDMAPLVRSPSDSHKSRKLPSTPDERRPPPVPPSLHKSRSGGDDEEESEESFIQSVHMPNITREEATSFVSEAGEEGVFLLRDGSGPDNDYVLVVYAESLARKYKISKVENQVYLVKDKKFPSVRALIKYYYDNTIPLRSNTKLTRPYKS